MINFLDNKSRVVSEDFLTYTALIFAILFWGLSFVAIKIVLTSFAPFVYVFLRFSLASCFFLLYMLRRGFPSLSFKFHKKLILIALFEPGLYFTFETIGLTYTTASKASIIIAMIPVVVMIVAHFTLGERISRKHLFGILLSFVGIIILVAGDPHFSWSLHGSFGGDLLIFAAVISTAFYMILVRDLGQSIPSFEITSFQILYGTLFFTPFFIIQLPQTQWSEISLESIAAILFLTIFATIGGFLCYNYVLSKISASRAAVFQNGTPVVTAVAAWIVLGESLTLLQICGAFLVIFALILTNIKKKQRDVHFISSKKISQ